MLFSAKLKSNTSYSNTKRYIFGYTRHLKATVQVEFGVGVCTLVFVWVWGEGGLGIVRQFCFYYKPFYFHEISRVMET